MAANATGKNSGARIDGLRAFVGELKELSDSERKWHLELAKSNRVVAKRAATDARGVARPMGGQQQHFEAAIIGKATPADVRIQIRDPKANAAFWGAKQDKTGWNEGNAGDPNQPKWIGNTWDVAVKGQGPIAINDSLADNLDSYIEDIWDGIDRVVAEAYPNGRL